MAVSRSSFIPLCSLASLVRNSSGARSPIVSSPRTSSALVFSCGAFLLPSSRISPLRSFSMAKKTTMNDKSEDGGHKVESENLNDDWKHRDPYSIHDNDFKARYEGSCHCGRVQYQLSREKPLDAKFCHCTTCQVLHAAPFQWAAIFHKSDINFTHGHHDLVWYDPGEKSTKHKLPCKITCGYCRSPIMDEGRNMILLYPSLIHFKSESDKKNFEPTCHMFYNRRVIDIPDGKPKWSGLNNDSDLLDEHANEITEKRKQEALEADGSSPKRQKTEE